MVVLALPGQRGFEDEPLFGVLEIRPSTMGYMVQVGTEREEVTGLAR